MENAAYKNYWSTVVIYMKNNSELRYGQCLFNVLCHLRPELAEKVRGGSLDPFYLNIAETEPFIEWLYKEFNDEPNTGEQQ